MHVQSNFPLLEPLIVEAVKLYATRHVTATPLYVCLLTRFALNDLIIFFLAKEILGPM